MVGTFGNLGKFNLYGCTRLSSHRLDLPYKKINKLNSLSKKFGFEFI